MSRATTHTSVPRPVDWTGYYQKEHEVQRFIPEEDPYEEHRVTLAEQLFGDVCRLRGSAPRRVLDVGCGDGNLVRTWIRRHGVEAFACDLSPARLGFARRAGGGCYAAGRATHLPFASESFDAVSLVEVLEHLEEPAAVLSELARVARSHLIVTVPYDQELIVKQCPHCLERFYVDGHIQRFDPARLRRVCAEAGLEVVSLRAYRVPSAWERSVAGRLLPAALRRVVNGTLVATRLMGLRRPKYLGIVAEKRA